MKPKVKLIGLDGNAFAIIGACKRAAKSMPKDDWQKFYEEATSGDYETLLAAVQEHFDVE